MEHISGEPLNVVLARHPNGLPKELGQQWFLALARATAYLHDHGIVHRDLKPANIFLENGMVKVGDYGLCKFMSGSQATRQSQSVGTVHYMAPEVSTGNYTKQIDIYAAGIILYEMLSGRPPFDGESAGEILMKHLTSPPDLNRLPQEYVPIVARALAKNPAMRYANMNEMIRAVESLSVERPAVVEVVRPVPAAKPAARPASQPILTALPAVTLRGQIAELSGAMALTPLFAALAATLLATPGGMRELTEIGSFFFLTVLCCWMVLIPAKFLEGKKSDSWAGRIVLLILGALVGGAALWMDGWIPRLPVPELSAAYAHPSVFHRVLPPGGWADVAAYLSYFALAFFALRWWKMADRHRAQRFGFLPILTAGFWSVILMLVWPQPWRGPVALVMTAVIVQLVSPWEQPPPPAPRRMRLRYA
jgi:hypothetical protein